MLFPAVSENKIGSEGVQHVYEALKVNFTLTELDFQCSPFSILLLNVE